MLNKICLTSNSVKPLSPKLFSELQIRERDHLQEWIAKQPDIFGEDLLIIQKEFSGFDRTQERLDLLALDKQGSLVIIENKLDDSGKDVTWQALKYASYCSSLKKTDITCSYQQFLDKTEPGARAEERISVFMGDQDFEEIRLNEGVSQRIILVAANFRPEVTSTVLWLMHHEVRLQCFEVVPYAEGNELFLNIEQIIPIRDAEDYMIGMAQKEQEAIASKTRSENAKAKEHKAFWEDLVRVMKSSSSPLSDSFNSRYGDYIGVTAGVPGVKFEFVVRAGIGRVQLYIDYHIKDYNKFIFDELSSIRCQIGSAFDTPLMWERLEGRASIIKVETPGVFSDREQWPNMIEFMTDAMCRLEAAVREPLREVGEKLKQERATSSKN